MAPAFGIAIQLRRVQNRWKCERVIVADSQMETQWLQWVKRAQAKVREFPDMEDSLRELIRKGECAWPRGSMRNARFLGNVPDGGRTVRTAVDGSSGPAKRPPVFPKPADGTGTSPIADLDRRRVDDRDDPHSVLGAEPN